MFWLPIAMVVMSPLFAIKKVQRHWIFRVVCAKNIFIGTGWIGVMALIVVIIISNYLRPPLSPKWTLESSEEVEKSPDANSFVTIENIEGKEYYRYHKKNASSASYINSSNAKIIKRDQSNAELRIWVLTYIRHGVEPTWRWWIVPPDNRREVTHEFILPKKSLCN